jgi:hypothetical protein
LLLLSTLVCRLAFSSVLKMDTLCGSETDSMATYSRTWKSF